MQKNPKGMYYGYTRVSNESQVQGQSLDVQKQLLENQLVLNDIPSENYTLLRDGGKSGRRTDNREEYQYLVEEITKGNVEGVFIYSLSHLNRNVRETLDFIDLCEKKGVRVVSVYERYDSNVPASKMILYVFSGLAEQQSDEQSVRIKNPLTMLKTFLLKLTTLVSQISAGVVLIGLMLFLFAILWAGLVYIANQLGDKTDPIDIEQVQTP